MNNSRSFPRFLGNRGHTSSAEPGAAMFRGLRLRLTLWYSAVLGAALILFSIALYVGVQQILFSSVQVDLASRIHQRQDMWRHSSDSSCPTLDSRHGPLPAPNPAPQGEPFNSLVACYNSNGTLLLNQDDTVDTSQNQLPTEFLSNTLAKTALQSTRPVTDIVDAGGRMGHVYRVAVVLSNPRSNAPALVLQMGESIEAQEVALQTLLTLLITFGIVLLFGAGLGGLFLADRALAPAHLAFTRQQRFIADASHELRTPLTLLRADAEVLLRSNKHLEAEDAALLEDIVAEANHMSTLANNMLTLARLDATENQHREHEVVRLDTLALAGVRRVKAFADAMNVAVQVESDHTLLVIGDAMLLEQAMLVLLDNAIKYNRPGGHVAVRTSIRERQAVIEVRDTGMGIANDHLLHLGERFYRVDKARSRKAGGTGLGLSIAHSIATSHGGTLTLTSTLDQGTTATLRLPLANSTTSNDYTNGASASIPYLSENTRERKAILHTQKEWD